MKENRAKGGSALRVKTFAFAMVIGMSTLISGELKISGDTYFHFSFEDAENNNFHIDRAYFTLQNKVSDKISYKFRTDIRSGEVTDFSVYLKNAKIDWKTDFGKFIFGLQGMNMFKVQENIWGYRFLEKSVMDKKKFASSADIGFGWEKSFGVVAISTLITNGGGYKKAETDQYKKISTRLMYGKSKLKEGFNTGVVFSYEPKDYKVINVANADTSIATGNTSIIGGFGGLVMGPLRAGAEYNVLMNNTSSILSTTLLSVYGNFHLRKNTSAYARVDVFGSDVDGSGEYYMILGTNYTVEKVLNIAPNIVVVSPEGSDSEITYRLSFRFKI